MTDTIALSERTREFLRALAGENRQQVLLLFADGQPRSVGQIAAELGIAQSTASEQLTILRRGGLAELQEVLRSCCTPDP